MKNKQVPTNYLLKLGFFPQHHGFGYLSYAIRLVSDDLIGYYSNRVDVFDALHDAFGVSRSKASRCIHYSIETAWADDSNTMLRQLFPSYSSNYPPSVTEFICRIAVELNNIFADEQQNETERIPDSISI